MQNNNKKGLFVALGVDLSKPKNEEKEKGNKEGFVFLVRSGLLKEALKDVWLEREKSLLTEMPLCSGCMNI